MFKDILGINEHKETVKKRKAAVLGLKKVVNEILNLSCDTEKKEKVEKKPLIPVIK